MNKTIRGLIKLVVEGIFAKAILAIPGDTPVDKFNKTNQIKYQNEFIQKDSSLTQQNLNLKNNNFYNEKNNFYTFSNIKYNCRSIISGGL